MEINIRHAQAEDAAAIVTVIGEVGWHASIIEMPPENAVATIAKNLALCAADNSHRVYVAEVDGIIRGYAAVHFVPYLIFTGPEGYVSELFLAPDVRGHGIGTKLLDTIEQEARARGCSRLGLLNSKTRESYQREFYKKRGWQERDHFVSFVLKLD